MLLLCKGQYLSVLPVDPKLGKMLIMGAVFQCFDPVLTIVSGLSVRDPFLLPQDKKDVSICLCSYTKNVEKKTFLVPAYFF